MDIHDLRVRIMMGLWHPSQDELIELIEFVEDELDQANEEVSDARKETEAAQADQITAEGDKNNAEERLEKYLQTENDTPEAMAARIVELTREITTVREENDKLNKSLKRRHSRKKSAPEIVIPTYWIPKEAPNVVRVAFGAKDPERAQALYMQAGTLDESPSTYAEAEELYREAIRLDPSLAVARTNLGNIRFRRGALQEAIQHWQDASRIDPKQPEAYYNIGFAYLDESQPSKAVPFFRAALSVTEDGDRIAADTHYNLASAFDEMGDVDSARVHWQKHVDLAPDGEWADYARKFLRDTNPSPAPPPVRKPHLTPIRGGKSKGES